jgi:uncharacterized protein (TIGR03790 family)
MWRLGAALTLLWFAVAGAWALTPEEILVVANSRCPEGVEIARQYCAKRHVPDSQIVLLPLSTSESLSRNAYESELGGPLRQFFERNPSLKPRIRCLLTTYGVPLSIGRYDPTPEERRVIAGLAKRLGEKHAPLHEQLAVLCSLARAIEVPVPAALENLKPEPSPLEKLLPDTVSSEIAAARVLLAELDKKIKTLPSYRHGEQRASQFGEIRARLVGQGRLEDGAVPVGEAQGGDGDLREYAKAKIASESREKLYAAREEADGLLGVCQQLLEDMSRVEKRESEASVDSELSLLYWGDYELCRWLPNVLNPVFASRLKPPLPPRTLMVARLDGPTPEVAAALVDRAIKGESEGLNGRFYVDASASQRAKGGLYKLYDESLDRLAQGVREHTTIEVVLDKSGDLFPPGACPHAALYCGWYSPTKYIDSFAWAPGAVGYHISSFGAQGLRKQDSENWCKRMIEKGVAATLGPVGEPYLHAFPPPEDFFRLFLSGSMSLVECYYVTNPFNSWRMVLIGDPLYNPFRDHPVITTEGSKIRQKAEPADQAGQR